ncbi:hypothetical protein EDD15DRAFT_2201563 [Pisolithus albus]|nr:hypothetical protein EDD15DRAFT_2201563 [Pisolithus albus]
MSTNPDIGQSVESYWFRAKSFEQCLETQESTTSEEVEQETSIDTNEDTIDSEDKDTSTSDSTQVYILPPYPSPVLLEHCNLFIDCESLSGDDHEQCASIPSNLTTLDGYTSRSPSGTSLDRVYTTTQVNPTVRHSPLNQRHLLLAPETLHNLPSRR